jgi:hypothetical protein
VLLSDLAVAVGAFLPFVIPFRQTGTPPLVSFRPRTDSGRAVVR